MGTDELYSKGYFSSYVTNPARQKMHQQELERVFKITKLTRGKVLDVGCGLGNFLKLFPESWDKYGTEVSQYAQRVAARKGINFSIPKKTNFFDLIVFRGTIQHLDTPLSEVKVRISQLKPNGWMVFLATPNAGSFCYRLWQDLPMIDEKYNFIIFSAKQLANILKLLGLKVSKIYYPYLETPYASPLLDHINFVLKLLGFSKKFAFWKNIMEIYAYKPK